VNKDIQLEVEKSHFILVSVQMDKTLVRECYKLLRRPCLYIDILLYNVDEIHVK